LKIIHLTTGIVGALVVLGACGGDEPRELTGYRREPAPVVGELSMPDLGAGGADFQLEAEPGKLLAVYFGYTNCPDFCPTTLSDLKLATRRLDDPSLVDVAMITVDPDRDIPVLDGYITSFFDDGYALGTNDAAQLGKVANPFGAQYQVSENDDGEIEVAHTTSLYAIDENGELVLTWQFGISIDDLHTDLELLLEDVS